MQQAQECRTQDDVGGFASRPPRHHNIGARRQMTAGSPKSITDNALDAVAANGIGINFSRYRQAKPRWLAVRQQVQA